MVLQSLPNWWFFLIAVEPLFRIVVLTQVRSCGRAILGRGFLGAILSARVSSVSTSGRVEIETKHYHGSLSSRPARATTSTGRSGCPFEPGSGGISLEADSTPCPELDVPVISRKTAYFAVLSYGSQGLPNSSRFPPFSHRYQSVRMR